MDHNDVRHKLSEYLDGSVSGPEKAEIEKHLISCEQCSAALTELRKTIEHIKMVEEVEPPAWMTGKIMATVRAAAEEKKSWFQRMFVPLPLRLPLQTVAVLFLAIASFYLYQTMQHTPTYDEAPSAQFSLEKKDVAPPMKSPKPASNERVQDKAAPEPRPAFSGKEASPAPRDKALDMKAEYAKPAPPEPAEQRIQGMSATVLEKREGTATANAPQMMQEQPPTAAVDALQAETARESVHLSRKAKAAGPAVQSTGCLAYEPAIVELSGIIKSVDFPGPPKYENIEKGDKRETRWILILERAVCVSGGSENEMNTPESRVAEVQLVLSSEKDKKYRSLLAKPVTVTGALFHASTGHHHRPVLLKVDTMTVSARQTGDR